MRKLGPDARELADAYFFETLIRVHRAGEGEPYTGLKPAGKELGVAIPAADKALEESNVEPVVQLLTDTVQAGVRERFKQAIAPKGFKPDDVAAGRAYVEAYVPFLHYVERLHEAATSSAKVHAHEGVEGAFHGDEH